MKSKYEFQGGNMKLTYTVSEASKVLGIGRTKMYELINSGEIKSIRFGDAIRISRTYVDELINPSTEDGQNYANISTNTK